MVYTHAYIITDMSVPWCCEVNGKTIALEKMASCTLLKSLWISLVHYIGCDPSGIPVILDLIHEKFAFG